MGLLEALQGQRIYLDTNIFIYAIESYSDYLVALEDVFEAADTGHLTVVTSELTLAEVLVKPLQEGDLDKQQAYCEALQSSESLAVAGVSREVLIEAAQIRASQKLKLPDAIHLTTALQYQCSTFLTNDSQFKETVFLPIVILAEAIA